MQVIITYTIRDGNIRNVEYNPQKRHICLI